MIKQSTLKKPLTVDNLHLSYGSNPILKGVSMTLQPGEELILGKRLREILMQARKKA